MIISDFIFIIKYQLGVRSYYIIIHDCTTTTCTLCTVYGVMELWLSVYSSFTDRVGHHRHDITSPSSSISPVLIGHFLATIGKNGIKLKIAWYNPLTIINNILKVTCVFPESLII